MFIPIECQNYSPPQDTTAIKMNFSKLKEKYCAAKLTEISPNERVLTVAGNQDAV